MKDPRRHVVFSKEEALGPGERRTGDLAIGEAARDFVFVYEDFGSTLLDAGVAHYAGRDAGAFHAEIRHWYLLEAVSWTLDMERSGRGDELRHGLAEIERELDSPAPGGREARS